MNSTLEPRPLPRPGRSSSGLRVAIALTLGLLMTPPGPAFQLQRLEKAELRVAADRSAYEPGAPAQIGAVMTIEDGWHTNSHRPTYDYLIPTEVSLEFPDDWPEATIDYPAGEMKKFGFADEPLSVYAGETTILGRLSIPDHAKEGTWPVTVTLTYQACDDRKCLPPVTTSQVLDITVSAAGVPQAGGVSGITTVNLLVPKTKSLPLMLLLGVLGGLILNAMPCVLPVLSLKVFGLVKSAGLGRSRVVVGSLATAAGIFISFWALALVAILARSAGSAVGWGIQFQEPVFVTFLALVVVLFCLNLWGLFEIPLPARLARVADSGPKQGVPGHLASGMFATLMATPCSAPFLGTAVGFGLGQEAPVILAIFTAIALGMALPYLLLAAAPGTAQWLPKPGPWMDKLRVVMGFLLAGAAVWLFYVLSAQMSTERLAFIELTLLGMALLIWVRHQGTQKPGLRVTAALGILLSMSLTLALAAGAQDGRGQRTVGSTNQLITWTTFDRQKAEELAREGHLVFVDVTADWCFTCKVNERLVLETPEVAAVFERHGVTPMKADWTNHSDSIARYLADFGRYGIPFYVLYRPFDEPFLFAELLTKKGLIRTVEEAASKTAAAQDQEQIR